MGQRLNIEIVDGEKTLANAYYHWSAYTSSSIELTNTIIEKFKSFNAENSLKKAVLLLQETGAGFTNDELLIAQENKDLACINLKNAEGRNRGLISITESGINDTRNWEEGRVTVDIVNKKINFEVLYELSEEDINDYYSGRKVVALPFDTENIPFEDFNAFSKAFVYDEDSYFKAHRYDDYFIMPIE